MLRRSVCTKSRHAGAIPAPRQVPRAVLYPELHDDGKLCSTIQSAPDLRIVVGKLTDELSAVAQASISEDKAESTVGKILGVFVTYAVGDDCRADFVILSVPAIAGDSEGLPKKCHSPRCNRRIRVCLRSIRRGNRHACAREALVRHSGRSLVSACQGGETG